METLVIVITAFFAEWAVNDAVSAAVANLRTIGFLSRMHIKHVGMQTYEFSAVLECPNAGINTAELTFGDVVLALDLADMASVTLTGSDVDGWYPTYNSAEGYSWHDHEEIPF